MVTKKYKIKASLSDVWNALTDPEIIEEWGGGPAEMSDENKFQFSLWGGDIYGRNTKVIKNKLLEQDWYGGKWEKPSKVIFGLSDIGNGVTQLELQNTDIPSEEENDIDSGWDEYYLGAIKSYLERQNR